jgi:type I restriction enzyme S subunit
VRWEELACLPYKQANEFERFRLIEGDIVLSLDRPFIGTGTKVARVRAIDLPCLLLQRVGRFQLNPALLVHDYLFLWIASPSFTDQIDPGRSNGVPHISAKQVESAKIYLPPLAEQHRIVAKVDELMTLCDQLEAAQQERERRRDRLTAASLQRLNQPAADATPEAQREHARFHLHHLPCLTTRTEHIKAMRQTIFSLAVRGLLVPQDVTNEPASVLLGQMQNGKAQLMRVGAISKEKTATGKASLTFPVPLLWQAVRLGDICNLVTSGSRGWAEFYANSGPKFLRAQNIRFGRLRLDDLACVNPPAKSEGSRTQVQTGDLLIVITGAGVTNPALLDRDLGAAYVSQHVALVRPSDTALSRWLLLCLMAGPSGRDELLERAYGAGKPGLNLDNIRSLSTPLPPLAEQHRIVAKVDELMALCDQLEAQLSTTRTNSRRLLESVLEAALAPD